MALAGPPPRSSDLDSLGTIEVQKGQMDSRTDPNSRRSSDLPSGEGEGRVQVLSFAGQGVTEIHSSSIQEHGHVHPITKQREDDHGIRRLPPELLSLIFTACREENETTVVLPHIRWFPWALGHVCSQWRQALWLVTEIWSDIEIRVDLQERKREIVPRLMDQVMSRTRCLISLQVPLLEVSMFPQIITPYAGRFQSLQLTLSFDLLGIFLNLPLNHISLKSLELFIEESPVPRRSKTLQRNALRNASHLDRFLIFFPYEIKRLDDTYFISGLEVPWSQLTSFDCYGPYSIADFHNVLSQCTSLVKCLVEVRAPVEREVADYTHQPVVLPRLRNLSIQPYGESWGWVPFLEPFSFPSLEILESYDQEVLEALEALVSRSGCHLKELDLFTVASFADPLYTDCLCNFLQRAPSLEILKDTRLPSVVFDLISCGDLLPHISTLICSVDTDGLDAFLNLMEQYPPGCGIQTARISMYLPNEPDHVDRRFLTASERFVTEGRDIRMEFID